MGVMEVNDTNLSILEIRALRVFSKARDWTHRKVSIRDEMLSVAFSAISKSFGLPYDPIKNVITVFIQGEEVKLFCAK